MSSEIYYDRAYIRVENRFIPLVNHGSNNCFEVGPSGREIPERYWEVLNYSDRHKFLFTDAEMLRVASEYEEINSHNRGGIRRSRNREFPAGGFGRWILRGMRYAHTVEEYTQYGNALLVIDGMLYMPLINRYSVIDGRLDEDCRQYILIHIALNIGKFII